MLLGWTLVITLFQMSTNDHHHNISPPPPLSSAAPNKPMIGWHGARALSVTECKQDCDWLLASPHWAVWKKGNNWPCGFKASRVRWWKGIRGGGFKAPHRRTPIGPGAIWVKRESKGILQRERGQIICWIFKIIEVRFRIKTWTSGDRSFARS